MYIHIGQDILLKKKDIIGVFDLDTSTVMKKTRDFLNTAEKRGQVSVVGFDLPKTFILAGYKQNTKVYISQISTTTLLKRSNKRRQRKYE